MYLAPEDFGLGRGKLSDLLGGDKDDNARIAVRILSGEKGPKRDVVLLNSAAAIAVSGRVPDLLSAFELAKESIDSGKALRKLEEIKKVSNSL